MTLTGAAAGAGAALAVREADGDTHRLNVVRLQHRLQEQGFLLDPELVKPVTAGP